LDISSRHSTGEQKKSKTELRQIISVAPGSRADKAGVKLGDRLLAINGKPIRDMIDYQFEASDANAVLTLEREQKELQIRIKNATGEPLGLEFAEPTFDGIKVCNNDCPFCFVYRTPKGYRPTLYIKDDDYRYSFMYGGFVTLTNLKDDDWKRIIEQRLTPLYVSVHSTEIELRRRLLGNATAPDVVEQLKRLNIEGITAHTQIVLVPTVNDGANLDKTIKELAALYPGVETAAVVPVGLAGGAGYDGDRRKSSKAHGRGFGEEEAMPMRPFTAAEAEKVITQVHAWQKQFKKTLGTPFVYLSDEFYLLCGQAVPNKVHYEDFDQIENGVGLVRHFLDDWKRTEKRLSALIKPVSVTIVTATLITPTFQPIITRLNEVGNLAINLLTVENKALGSTVTVAGLLTGRDVIEVLLQYQSDGYNLGDVIFLPQVMLDKKGYGGRFLDNLTPADVERATGRKVIMAGLISEVWQAIQAEGAGKC
jgi:putative radical SAM enzyme (TIGR03279 family)